MFFCSGLDTKKKIKDTMQAW